MTMVKRWILRCCRYRRMHTHMVLHIHDDSLGAPTSPVTLYWRHFNVWRAIFVWIPRRFWTFVYEPRLDLFLRLGQCLLGSALSLTVTIDSCGSSIHLHSHPMYSLVYSIVEGRCARHYACTCFLSHVLIGCEFRAGAVRRHYARWQSLPKWQMYSIPARRPKQATAG